VVELNIGGQGLANGYFGRDDLTASAFREIALPGGPQMLYRTGDLARKLADGTIEVLGRIDGQIKLRGFRIELGEIEMAMRQIDGVDKAAVALQDDPGGQKQLVGYVVPAAGCDPAARDLMQALRSRLPEYMVPTAWVTLSALPQTLNGKLDRKALPRPTSVAAVTPLRSVVAPVSDFEVRLTEIWKQVLGLDEIGTTETLFALGADSLKVFRIASRMLEAGLDLEARHLLQYPTIRELAAYAASPREDNKRAARPSLRDFRHGARRQSSQTAVGTA
jgi:aryl carrier-like protein